MKNILVRSLVLSLALSLALTSALIAAPGPSTRLLRTPTVSATQIAFAYANNIWIVDRSGGSARRLTTFAGPTSNPHFSPDGKWMVLISFPTGIPNHPPGKDVILRIMPAPSSRSGYKPDRSHPQEIVKLFGGQGTMNVNSWSPDGKKFAYVTYVFGS